MKKEKNSDIGNWIQWCQAEEKAKAVLQQLLKEKRDFMRQ